MTASPAEQVGSPAAPGLWPFDRDDFRADLTALTESTCAGWQRWAAEAVLLARMAAQVPGSRHDIAWKSFVREVAVARRCSDQAAGKDIFIAVALTRSHPTTLALVQAGQLPRWNAQVLVEESAGLSPAARAEVEAVLAERACRLTPSRIRDGVRKIELRHDGDAAAVREATATSARSVRLEAQPDGQADLVISGPALPVVAFYEALTAAARAAKAAGDPRGLGALRFDLALGVTPDPTPDVPATPVVGETLGDDQAASDADPTSAVHPTGDSHPTDGAQPCGGLAPTLMPTADPAPASASPSWLGDRRRVRPVQALIHLPVTTALGLDNEPGWLAGYGWVSAPQCRQWMTTAELRQVCVKAGGPDAGTVVDLADKTLRPEPTPAGVRDALLAMVADPGPITDKTWRTEPRHDPSRKLTEFVDLRDMFCDGPTGSRVPAPRCHTDHNEPYPQGPTAAWNLRDRADRTHQLKHHGWVPLPTDTGTRWYSPAGQVIEIDRYPEPPPGIDPRAQLPDPDELLDIDTEMTREPDPTSDAPWLLRGWDEPPPF